MVLHRRVRHGRAACSGRVCLQTVLTPEGHLGATPQHVLSRNTLYLSAAMQRFRLGISIDALRSRSCALGIVAQRKPRHRKYLDVGTAVVDVDVDFVRLEGSPLRPALGQPAKHSPQPRGRLTACRVPASRCLPSGHYPWSRVSRAKPSEMPGSCRWPAAADGRTRPLISCG